MDRKTRKRMTIYGMLHLRADMDRLYLPRRCGSRGLIGVENRVRAGDIGLSNYVQKSEEPLLKAVRNESSPSSEKGETVKHFKEMKMKKGQEDWKAKELHGQILHQTADIRNEASWDWMMRGNLKKEAEGLITAAQDQALRITNVIKAKIEKEQLSPLCRMWL